MTTRYTGKDMIRKLEKNEYNQATDLALNVYISCGRSDFNDEGLESFKSFINNEQLMNELIIYGAFEQNELIGILGIRNNGKHISLFFIQPEHHRKGIGKKLFDYMENDYPVHEMTVNSSTYAVPFYKRMGFEQTNDKQTTNGITYVPMKK